MPDNDNDKTDEVRTSERVAEKDAENQEENCALKKTGFLTSLINLTIKFIIF